MGDIGALLEGLDHPTVLAAMGPQQPDALLRVLIDRSRADEQPLTLLIADLTGRWAFLDAAGEADVHEGRLRLVSVAGGVPRRIADLAEPVHASLWEADAMIADGRLPFDVLVARTSVTPEGRVTFGEMLGYTPSALGRAVRVGVEQVPCDAVLPGSEDFPTDAISAGMHAVGRPESEPGPRIDGASRSIASSLAGLVPNGATLQIGMGSLPEAMLDALHGHRDLGLHSGLLPGSVRPLISASVITGSRKGRDQGLHVATGVVGGGSRGWGPDLRLLPVSVTHDPAVLGSVGALWAVNSAFEVDLEGNANAEFAGALKVASGGGQLDFMKAASADPTGAAVIMLPSRARGGSPRIVASLADPSRITTPGHQVDIVVTEFGAADLRGLDSSARAAAILRVAHPDDRAGLAAVAL